MLKLKTTLRNVDNFNVQGSDVLMNSGEGVTGTWVVKEGDQVVLPSAGALGAMPIFTESNRDGTAGWTPQATAAYENHLTVILGTHRALTDQFTGSPSPGDGLSVDADGKLQVGTASDGNLVAVCTKAPHDVTELDQTYNVIEYRTV